MTRGIGNFSLQTVFVKGSSNIILKELVLLQGDIDGFRVTQMSQDKAQSAENGYFLIKGCYAVLEHLGRSLRASREAVVRGVASPGKGVPLAARRALRPTASRLAAPINITLLNHWPSGFL